MDLNLDTANIWEALRQARGQDAVERACVGLMKVHYRHNPGVVLEECLAQGWTTGDRDFLAASFALARRLRVVPGLERIEEGLCKELASRVGSGDARPGLVAGFVEIALENQVRGLWEIPLDGHASILHAWLCTSAEDVFPQALSFIRQHPSGVNIPPETVASLLSAMEGLSVRQIDSFLDLLPVQESAAPLQSYMAKYQRHNDNGPILALAPRFPDHPLWHQPDFWESCLTQDLPSVYRRLAEVVSEETIDRFSSTFQSTDGAVVWEEAVARRRAREQVSLLDAATASVVSDKKSMRL